MPEPRFKKEFVPKIRKLMDLGATDVEVATILGISESTLLRWRLTKEEVTEALTVGKVHADNRIEVSLYKRASGYTRRAVKIVSTPNGPETVEYDEDVPPDTNAIKHWLQCRKRKEWIVPQQGADVTVTGADGSKVEVKYNVVRPPDYEDEPDA